MNQPTHQEVSLALAKAVLEVAEELQKADDPFDWEGRSAEVSNDPAYIHFYHGARSAGLDHRAAHKMAVNGHGATNFMELTAITHLAD